MGGLDIGLGGGCRGVMYVGKTMVEVRREGVENQAVQGGCT
jgi:hypothetical protein